MIERKVIADGMLSRLEATNEGLVPAAASVFAGDWCTVKKVGAMLGALLAVFWICGVFHARLEADILGNHHYSIGPSAEYRYRYDPPRISYWQARRRYNGRERYREEEAKAMHVRWADRSEHRLLNGVRTITGWALILGVIMSIGFYFYRERAEEAEALFGKDTEGYRDVVDGPSFDERAERALRDDWLLSGPPGTPGRDPAPEPAPRFGRKGL